MRKIYNEVIIDMNPESSSYGDTLYEDSFEYDGPMALAKSFWEKTQELFGVGKAFVTGGEKEAIGEYMEPYVQDFQTTLIPYYESERKRIEQEGIPPSQKINYEDFAKFIDLETGTVTDPYGLMEYMKLINPELKDMIPSELLQNIKRMPSITVDAKKRRELDKSFESDVYGLRKGLTEARQTSQSAEAISGITRPGGGGLGGIDKELSEKFYRGYGELQSGQTTDIYGLKTAEEEEFRDWVFALTGE
jgi:hypothetical protein